MTDEERAEYAAAQSTVRDYLAALGAPASDDADLAATCTIMVAGWLRNEQALINRAGLSALVRDARAAGVKVALTEQSPPPVESH